MNFQSVVSQTGEMKSLRIGGRVPCARGLRLSISLCLSLSLYACGAKSKKGVIVWQKRPNCLAKETDLHTYVHVRRNSQ